MAPAVTGSVETKVFVSRTSILTPEDLRFPLEDSMPIRNEQYYPTTSTTNSYYYRPSSATSRSTSAFTSLTTVVVSKTATITLTTIALITSESTVTVLEPTEAPLLSSASTNIDLSPRQIAGIVLGALAGLLLFVLIFYLLLMRSEWTAWFSNCRVKGPEQIGVEVPGRGPKKLTKPTKKPTRKTTRVRHASAGKQAGQKPRPTSMLITPKQRQTV